MKGSRYLAHGQARRRHCTEDVIDVAVPQLNVIVVGVQIVLCIRR
jgi:hypothetical protein